MSRAQLNLIALVVFAAVLGGGYLYWWERRVPKPTSTGADAAAVEPRDTIKAIGRIEPAGGITDVGGTTGERVEKLLVKEGQPVHAGDKLAQLGSYDLRQSELDLAKIQLSEGTRRLAADKAYGDAVVAEAEAAVEQLRLADLDEAALQSKVDSLKLKLSIAEADYARMERTGKEIIPDQELQHQKLVIAGAKTELDAAESQLVKFKQSRPIQKREAEAKLATARANQDRLKTGVQIESLEKQVVAAEQKLQLSMIRAPHDGTVLKILTTEGESIGQRPILLLGNTDQMYVVAEVYETDIQYVDVKKKPRAMITSGAFPGHLSGTVETVGMTVAKNETLSLDPTASADNRVVKVWIKLDNSAPVKDLVDLQVNVEIDASGQGFAEQDGKGAHGG